MAIFRKNNKTPRPSLLLFATEGGRAIAEWGLFHIAKTVKRYKKQGNGEPVIVLPGFMTSDRSTHTLRTFLTEIGYSAYAWELGRNYGNPDYVFKTLDRIEAICAKHQQKITIIGWSLGGVYAREIAKEMPELVNQIITMGSPFAGLTEKNNAAWLYTLLSGKRVEDLDEQFLQKLHKPPPVPVTAIYTKEDGIVAWQHCMEKENRPDLQNIEVKGSHCGLGHNITVLSVIANRLNQNTETWKPFKPTRFQRYLYPNLA